MTTDPTPSIGRDQRDLLVALVHRGVEFMVVGGHAVAVHGLPRATKDLDVWIRPTPDNARRVFEALADFGAPLSALAVGPEDFEAPHRVVQLGIPPNRIDLMTAISGVDFDAAWPARTSVALAGVDVAFLGRDALIRNKRAAGREQDLADAARLEKLRPRPDGGKSASPRAPGPRRGPPERA